MKIFNIKKHYIVGVVRISCQPEYFPCGCITRLHMFRENRVTIDRGDGIPSVYECVLYE